MAKSPSGAHQGSNDQHISDLVLGFIALLSPEGTLLEVNQSALDFVGATRDELVGMPFWQTPWWRDDAKSRKALKNAIRKGALGESSRFDALHTGKDGQVMSVDFTLTPRFNEDGIVVSLVPEARDVTATNEAISALREGELRLRLACDVAGIGTWTWDLPSDQLYWDDRQFELFGFAKGDGKMTGDRAISMIHPDDKVRVTSAVAASVENDVPFQEEFRIMRQEGDIRWLFGRGATLRDEDSGKPTTIIGVNYDITERKAAEEQLAQLNADLEARVSKRTRQLENEMQERERAQEALSHAQRLDAIGHLAGGVAHDFNNLLTVIGGNLELVEMRTVDDRVAPLISDALEAVEAGASLNKRLLSFARKRPLEPMKLNLNKRIESAKRLLGRTLDENIALETTLTPGVWEVLADAGELDSAILNLAVNAADAMPKGGKLSIVARNQTLGEDDVRSLSDAQAGEFVQIAVSDTGTGMTPEILENAITPFFTTKGAGRGSGLGLSSVFGFAGQSGGFVTIDSAEGQGTTVRIHLPRAMSSTGDLVEKPSEERLPLGQGKLVLLVEDNPAVLRISRERLVELGYTVIEASNAAEAIETLKDEKEVSLIFSDIRMPGELSGYGLAKWARENRPEIRVLLTSGDSALKTGDGQADVDLTVAVLPKPFSMNALAMALEEALASAT